MSKNALSLNLFKYHKTDADGKKDAESEHHSLSLSSTCPSVCSCANFQPTPNTSLGFSKEQTTSLC